MAVEVSGEEAVTKAKRKLTFRDLPAETQQGIISHCSQTDLICVSLVSKHFHELASAQLYRNFHIIFPDDDDIQLDSPIDGLAGGLDTFTTSDYDYAKHLKDLSMDTLSAGVKGELSYQSYLYSASCGKFLNTLLCLTLKKAKALEAFRWNIRVELSRPVYRELHRIASLKKLHIRMQAGESYYVSPPPLPISIDHHTGDASSHWMDITPVPVPDPTPLPSILSYPVTIGNAPFPSGPPPPLVPPSKSLPKSRASRRGLIPREPSTLSGFKNLKSLCILDIDDLDIVTELKTCIKNSSSTLTELQLSLSDSLASQARKPPPDSDPDDSDVEDDFQVVSTSHATGHDATGPAKVFRAQEERKVQEAVLSRIFDIEPLGDKKPEAQPESDDTSGINEEGYLGKDPREDFIASIRAVSSQLMTLLNGSGEFSTSQQDILDTIERASRKYVDSGDLPTQKKDAIGDSEIDETLGGTEAGPSGQSNNLVAETTTINDTATRTESHLNSQSALRDSKLQTAGAVDAGADEALDILHDEETVKKLSQGGAALSTSFISNSSESPILTPASSATSSSPATEKVLSNLASQKMRYQGLLAQRRHFEERYEASKIESLQVPSGNLRSIEFHQEAQKNFMKQSDEIQSQIRGLKAEIDSAEKQVTIQSESASAEIVQRCMNDYVRDTRGFSLESLSLHLITVKVSVLSRRINLRSLRQLTLLNVGNQAPIWTFLSKENKVAPLPLRSVYTDNVSNAFLACVSQLEELHELFMLERSPKHKPESFAPRSTTSIDQIRRLVLSKHMPTLKRLMIKDESTGSNWDVNEKTMVYICNRGKQLEELAVSMNIHSVHAFMQYFSGLVNLRAIHILHFKNNDTCIWVMREILRFIVDNLSHRPELKLEWIAMEDDRVDRVVRPSESDSSNGKKKAKGKGKAQAIAGSQDAFPVLPSVEVGSESESDEELFDSGTRLRFKTVGPLQFYDVWGVKIFEKEIRSGKL